MSYWVSVLIASSALALVLGLLTAAIQIAGISSRKLAYVLIFLGWVIGTAAIWISGLPLEYRMVCIVSLVIMIIFLIWWMVKNKVKQDPVIINHPWLETGSLLAEPNKKPQAIQLYISVRDKTVNSDARHARTTISSLHNLKLEVWMPVAADETGWHEYQVDRVEAAEYNNRFPKYLKLIELKSNITVLVIESSSNNASWYGTVVLHQTGDRLDWEKYLEGAVNTPQGEQTVLVGEVCQKGARIYTDGERINVTPELLMQFGIPKVNSDQAKVIMEELGRKNNTRRYIAIREGLRIVIQSY
jgi:hypothetical protein